MCGVGEQRSDSLRLAAIIDDCTAGNGNGPTMPGPS